LIGFPGLGEAFSFQGRKGPNVQVTVQQLAALVGGQVHGDGDLLIRAARPLHQAGPEDISFVENERNLRHLKTTRARAAVVTPALAARLPDFLASDAQPITSIHVPDSLFAFVTIFRHFHGKPEPQPHGIDPLASIHPTVQLGPDSSVFPYVVIGEGTTLGARCQLHSGAVVGRNCRLGDDVVLYPHAVLYDGTLVGDRVIIHAGAVLGADGFGYRLQDGRHVKVPQFGCVEIGADVEIGAGSAIDRGTFQATRIGAGTKIDNLVQVGHNVQIGQHNLLVAGVGIAGSCTTGDYVIVAGQAGLADHVQLGDRAVIGAQSGVARDVEPGERMLGSPARAEGEEKRIFLSLNHLPALYRDIRRIKKELGIKEEA
jgi:UDP-3-O-[3-hydroxymyristoyl] glucosamine N-acyltransferase